jgi:hypothetical protein
MPTNKLWIEHTERAAWESVTALRSELAEAKRRLERLTPPVEGWQPLLDALDALKEEHALGGKTYADVVRGLVDRLGLADTRLRAAQEDRARAHLPPNPVPAEEAPRAGDAPADFTALARSFVRAMQRRYGELGNSEASMGADELVTALASKLDETGEMDEIELADAAIDIAVLALCLHKAARAL